MKEILELVVNRDARPKPPADPLAIYERNALLAMSCVLLGVALIGCGMLCWINSEAFAMRAMEQLQP